MKRPAEPRSRAIFASTVSKVQARSAGLAVRFRAGSVRSDGGGRHNDPLSSVPLLPLVIIKLPSGDSRSGKSEAVSLILCFQWGDKVMFENFRRYVTTGKSSHIVKQGRLRWNEICKTVLKLAS